jgi:hypothetical protein
MNELLHKERGSTLDPSIDTYSQIRDQADQREREEKLKRYLRARCKDAESGVFIGIVGGVRL